MNPTQLFAALMCVPFASIALAEEPKPLPAIQPKSIVISPDKPESLAEGIELAAAQHLAKLVIPPGIYKPQASGRYYMRFTQLADLEIDATGVTLLRTDPTKGGIEFDNCKNVTLRGITLVNQVPPFTQGRIEKIAPDGKWYELKLDDGYPDEFGAAPSDVFTGYVFDATTRQWKPGTGDSYARDAESVGPRTYRLHFKDDAPAQPAAVGDLMAFRGTGTTDIFLGKCEGINLTGVTIKNGGGFCVHEADGEGRNHYSFTVTYGPKPVGATEAPLIACNADAFHSSSMRHGPTLENCRFEGMPDDGIAIHGSYNLVTENSGDSIILCLRGQFLKPGDPLRLFTKEGGFLDEATVKSVEILRSYQPAKPIENFRFRNIRLFARVTLDHPLSTAAPECLVSDPAANGSGYIIRNCTISNHRARGMLLKADDGLVENNTIDGSTMAGIVLAPEIWWNEACYSRNVTLRGNTVRHVGYQNVGAWMPQAGAITVRGDAEALDHALNVTPGHRHITIENNTIQNCDGLQLLISHAQDVTIKGNHFVHAQQHESNRGADRGIDTAALIQIGDCRNVHIANNTFSDRGAFGKDVVKAMDPKQVQGAEDGMKPAAAK